MHLKSENYKLQRNKISVKDFIAIKIIRGEFREVRVCWYRKSNAEDVIKNEKTGNDL